MEVLDIFGLPAHPLLVHLPIVAVPATLILIIVFAAVADWRRVVGPICVVLAGLCVAAAVMAKESGEALLDVVGRTPLLDRHAEGADRFVVATMAMFVLVVAAVAANVLARRSRQVHDEVAIDLTRTGDPAAIDVDDEPDAGTAPPPDTQAAASSDRRRRLLARATPLLAVGAALVGLGATVLVVQVGHTGATAVWGNLDLTRGAGPDRDGDNARSPARSTPDATLTPPNATSPVASVPTSVPAPGSVPPPPTSPPALPAAPN